MSKETKKMEQGNWVENLIEFYDFVWEEGTKICGRHVNEQLIEDFKEGGELFQEMVRKISEEFPTEADARKAFEKSAKDN